MNILLLTDWKNMFVLWLCSSLSRRTCYCRYHFHRHRVAFVALYTTSKMKDLLLPRVSWIITTWRYS